MSGRRIWPDRGCPMLLTCVALIIVEGGSCVAPISASPKPRCVGAHIEELRRHRPSLAAILRRFPARIGSFNINPSRKPVPETCTPAHTLFGNVRSPCVGVPSFTLNRCPAEWPLDVPYLRLGSKITVITFLLFSSTTCLLRRAHHHHSGTQAQSLRNLSLTVSARFAAFVQLF